MRSYEYNKSQTIITFILYYRHSGNLTIILYVFVYCTCRSRYHIYERCAEPTRDFPVPFPEEGRVYDYQFVKEGLGQWVPWSDALQNVEPIAKDAQFNSIIVPTVDTIRYTFLMDLLVKHQKPCLFVGPTGTGKSVYIQV